ncbi:MAG: cobalt ECF transporter T component CbiQ, partial [Clostridium sp.]|nr:cobalt ECF transporter T component CbiQ [Clostridium sp.]
MRRHKHEGIYSIDLYAYSSKMRNMNPKLKIVFAVLALIVCISADNIYVSLFISITMGIITVCIGGVKLHDYISLLTIPIAFMIMGSIAIAIGFSTRPVGQYNLNLNIFYVYSSDESMIKTLEVILKAFGAVSALYMMTLSTNASEIISSLRSIHVPKIIIELMNLIYRFIFILIDVQCKMKNSAQSRLGYVDFKRACYSFGSTAGNLLVVSMKKANAYYDAMESRCYDGEMNFLEEEKTIKTKHIAGAAA